MTILSYLNLVIFFENFLLKNLEGIEKVANFALAFEKHPTEGRSEAGTAEAVGKTLKRFNKFFLRKVWKL